MGRGRGFSVVSRESGIDDRHLASALKPKVLNLLSVLGAHGHVTKIEIIKTIGAESDSSRTELASAAAMNAHALEAELMFEKKTREFVEREVTDLQLGLSRLHEQLRDAERRDAVAQRRVDELREHTTYLVAATREGVESLQWLRAELKGADRGRKRLADHVRKMRAIVESVQGLWLPQKPGHANGAAIKPRDNVGRRA